MTFGIILAGHSRVTVSTQPLSGWDSRYACHFESSSAGRIHWFAVPLPSVGGTGSAAARSTPASFNSPAVPCTRRGGHAMNRDCSLKTTPQTRTCRRGVGWRGLDGGEPAGGVDRGWDLVVVSDRAAGQVRDGGAQMLKLGAGRARLGHAAQVAVTVVRPGDADLARRLAAARMRPPTAIARGSSSAPYRGEVPQKNYFCN
jgi:hypothetical protein